MFVMLNDTLIMDIIFDNFIAETGVWGLVLLGGVLLLFFVQLWYYSVRYGAALRRNPARKKKSKGEEEKASEPISFVTAIYDPNYYYIEDTLPRILAQDYPLFEVVLVDLSGDPDFSEAMKLATMNDGRVNVIRLAVNPQFPISTKMALNVAIKAARYENILISTTDIVAPGNKWFAGMGAGFASADIVLGYSPLETRRGQWNLFMRAANVASGMRWVSAAMRGKPYRGTINNLGITRKLYFDNNGFNHLNLNIGEDDLFVQYLAKNARACAVVDKNSIVKHKQYGGLDWWNRRRLLLSNAYRFYTKAARRYIGWELWSRVLFFASALAALILLPAEGKIAVAGIVLLRYIIVAAQTLRVGRSFGERRLFPAVGLYDFFSPFYEAALAISRRLRRTPGVWR